MKGLTGFLLVGVMLGAATLTLGGCAKKTVSLEPPPEKTAKMEDRGKGAPAAPEKPVTAEALPDQMQTTTIAEAGEEAGASESLETPPPAPGEVSGLAGDGGAAGVVEGSRTSLGLLPVYFDFDKSVIRPDQEERMRANALYLKNNPATAVRIEGNCDDRGTNEYNMALGDWRAMSAKKYLANLGVEDGRLTTLSYGEERPVNPGQDEGAWAQNRRDDFVIVN